MLKSSKLKLPIRFGGPICVTKRNFVPIGRTVAETGRFSIFQDGSVRHIGFLKLKILPTGPLQKANMRLHAKFRADLLNVCGDGRFGILHDGGRPPSWICFTCISTTHVEYLLVFVTM